MRTYSFLAKVVIVCALAVTPGVRAEVVIEYDAAANKYPDQLSPPWDFTSADFFGEMVLQSVSGSRVLHQDWTADDPDVRYENYTSPEAPGLMTIGNGAYGIEFRVQALSDVPRAGYSLSANCHVAWADDKYHYNMSPDLWYFDDPADPNGAKGSVLTAKDDMIPVTTGIDWSTPHTVFVGYDGGANPSGIFNIFIDGVFVRSFTPEEIGQTHVAGWQDRICFGDTTAASGEGLPDEVFTDTAADWYYLRVHDVSALVGMGCGDPNHPYPVGDLDRDCVVDINDFAIVNENWLADNAPPAP